MATRAGIPQSAISEIESFDCALTEVVTKDFGRRMRAAGLGVRLHDMRHTCATWLLAAGVQPKVVQVILGHSSFNVTMDIYGHVLDGATREGMEQLGTWLTARQTG